MAIFSGLAEKAVGAVTSLVDGLGFDWVTNAAGVLPVTTPISIGLQVDDESPAGATTHIGGFTLQVPNHAPEFGDIAINMAQETLAMIELAVAVQTISDPSGGITIKDALDPYHYEVVKQALEENNEPVPEPANPGATLLSKLGGGITASGALSGIGTAADAMEFAGYGAEFLKFTPAIMPTPAGVGVQAANFGFRPGGRIGSPIIFDVVGAWPNISVPLAIMSSCISIKSVLLTYTVGLLRNSIDTSSGAILLKNVLDDFTSEVSSNAINKAKGEGAAPSTEVQIGEDGIF